MTKSVLPKTSGFNHIAHLSRSGFDVSQSLAFTAAPGMLLPIYSDFLNSGEKVVIKSVSLVGRTQPLVTAAMCDVDFDIDTFFVPMTMLYTAWNQVRRQTNDFISSLYRRGDQTSFGRGSVGFPIFSIDTLLCTGDNTTASYKDTINNAAVFAPNATSPSSNAVYLPNSDFEVASKSMFRMADLLGFNPYSALYTWKELNDVATISPVNPNVFPYKALAYQCAYQCYYRNDDYEYRNISSYNVDYGYGDTLPFWGDPETTSSSQKANPSNPFVLRYADYRRDYFNDLKPSPLSSSVNSFGVVGQTNIGLDFIDNWLYDGANKSLATEFGIKPSNAAVSPYNSLTPGSRNEARTQVVDTFSDANSTGSLRSVFALEKLLRITGRAAKTADAQILAHLGFKVPHDVKHDISLVHSSHGILHIGEVVSTSDTYNGSGGSALGEIAGKGFIHIEDKRKVKFTAPVDGVLISIFRAVPQIRYVSTFDKQNSVANRTDLYIEEYDKLGMQPMFGYEITNNPRTGSDGINTSRVGWQTRYSQFKRKYNRATSVFNPKPYISGSYPADPNSYINQYSAWVVTRSPFQYSDLNAAYYNQPYLFKCAPTALNSIMAIPYSPTISEGFDRNNPATMFYTDPFICDFRMNITKVSTMSPSGEPDMISL